jgi:hypothetical protein
MNTKQHRTSVSSNQRSKPSYGRLGRNPHKCTRVLHLRHRNQSSNRNGRRIEVTS